MDNQLYIDALLDGLESARVDLSDLHRLCGFPETGNRFVPLVSILGQVGEAGKDLRFTAAALGLDSEGVFAKESPVDRTAAWLEGTRKGLAELRAHFAGRLDSLAYRYTLYHFLHAYGARVAYAGAADGHDASWFDRNRVLGAVAACRQKSEAGEGFLLLKGAVSGIQTYIYNDIKAEQIGEADQSAKKLRGRSFLVAFINQVVAESIVERLGLEQANVLFVGGGQFTLLLPHNPSVEEELARLLKSINLGLLQNIGMSLSLITAGVTAGEDLAANFADYYTRVNKELEAAKFSKHQHYLPEVFQLFAKNEEDNGSSQTGRIARRGANKNEEIELGRLAPYARYILEVAADDPHALEAIPDRDHQPAIRSLSFLGKHFYILKEEEQEDQGQRALLDFMQTNREVLGHEGLRLKVIALNDPALLNTIAAFSETNLNLAFGFRFLGNEAPIYESTEGFADDARRDAVMLFEDLARLDKDGRPALPYEQLAVMRLDVDDLGAIFARGLGQHATMERLLCLSREFQLFFGGYLNVPAKKHHIYVTYSGGDDAFLVGSWLNVLRFAKELEEAFREFTCKNKEVNFSAGIFLCSAHYPVPRLAREAEVLENTAKSYPQEEKELSKKTKNALTVFNHTLPWDRFQEAMSFAEDELVPEILRAETKSVRRAMVQRFLSIIRASREDEFEYYRLVAGLHSLLSRQGYGRRKMEGDEQQLDAAGRIVKRLLKDMKTDREKFKDYTIPFHIALYQSKTK